MGRTFAREATHPSGRCAAVVCLLLAIAQMACKPAPAPALQEEAAHERGWRLTWSDEFNGPEPGREACYDGTLPPQCMTVHSASFPCPASALDNLADLDKCNWSVLDIVNWMPDPALLLNSFDPERVTVEDGELVLSAASVPAPPGGFDCDKAAGTKDCPIESGGLLSRPQNAVQGFSQEYGRFEVRARLPDGPGSWPAHWLLHESNFWPDPGEIDVMEMWSHSRTRVFGTLHDGAQITWEGQPRRLHIHSGGPYDARNSTYVHDYHVFAVEWGPDFLRYYVDGLLYREIEDGETATAEVKDGAWKTIGETVHPIAVPSGLFYWILNSTVTLSTPTRRIPTTRIRRTSPSSSIASTTFASTRAVSSGHRAASRSPISGPGSASGKTAAAARSRSG